MLKNMADMIGQRLPSVRDIILIIMAIIGITYIIICITTTVIITDTRGISGQDYGTAAQTSTKIIYLQDTK